MAYYDNQSPLHSKAMAPDAKALSQPLAIIEHLFIPKLTDEVRDPTPHSHPWIYHIVASVAAIELNDELITRQLVNHILRETILSEYEADQGLLGAEQEQRKIWAKQQFLQLQKALLANGKLYAADKKWIRAAAKYFQAVIRFENARDEFNKFLNTKMSGMVQALGASSDAVITTIAPHIFASDFRPDHGREGLTVDEFVKHLVKAAFSFGDEPKELFGDRADLPPPKLIADDADHSTFRQHLVETTGQVLNPNVLHRKVKLHATHHAHLRPHLPAGTEEVKVVDMLDALRRMQHQCLQTLHEAARPMMQAQREVAGTKNHLVQATPTSKSRLRQSAPLPRKIRKEVQAMDVLRDQLLKSIQKGGVSALSPTPAVASKAHPNKHKAGNKR